jgi:hypothetical protein
VIFSLFANSRARSKGILGINDKLPSSRVPAENDLPDAFQMHWANLNNVLLLLTLENTITAASGHTSNIEKFGAVNHMIVYSN